jgi:hypothetical protein
MKWLPSPETRAAVFKHPFFLAGLAVVALLGVTAAVLVVADSLRGGDVKAPAVVVSPVGSTTVGPISKTASASGVSGTTNATTAVRSAPGTRTPVLGTLPSKIDVEIDGRTTDAQWLRIVFPPNSSLHGWIEASSLDIVGDPNTLIVATPEPPEVVELPTDSPAVLTSVAAAQSAQPTASTTVTPTPTGGDLPDLAIDGTTVSNGKLFITVVNQGKGTMNGDLVVAVFNSDGTKLLGGATLPKFTLAPGRSIDIGTGFAVTEDQTLFLVVDPNGTVAESNDNNNNRTVAIAVGQPSRTPLPGEETPTPDIPATLVALATATAEARAAETPDIPATLIALATQTAEAAQ